MMKLRPVLGFGSARSVTHCRRVYLYPFKPWTLSPKPKCLACTKAWGLHPLHTLEQIENCFGDSSPARSRFSILQKPRKSCNMLAVREACDRESVQRQMDSMCFRHMPRCCYSNLLGMTGCQDKNQSSARPSMLLSYSLCSVIVGSLCLLLASPVSCHRNIAVHKIRRLNTGTLKRDTGFSTYQTSVNGL